MMASCHPYNAPACVDDTRCDPPMAADAIKIPGPKAFQVSFSALLGVEIVIINQLLVKTFQL